jgi:uncharacterized protein
MTAPCLYECTVFHRRLWPKRHEFLNKIFLFHLDVDALGDLPKTIPFLRVNAPGIYSFRDRDHFRMVDGGPRANVEAFLASQGISERPARIGLLTNLRFLGYTFNPVSVWYCYREDGSPLAAIAEVGNTFLELKPYLVPVVDGKFHARAVKHFYVSPFSALDLAFVFRFEVPGERLAVLIDDYRGEERILVSSLTGRCRPLTAGNLLALTARYPFITLKVITLIHWQALRLWLKGLPFIRKEDNPQMQTGVFNPRRR